MMINTFIASANPAYELNFSENEEETSFMEEDYASSNEELVEEKENRMEVIMEREEEVTELKQLNVMPYSMKIQGKPRYQTATAVDYTTSEDSDDVSLVMDSQPSSPQKQPTKKRQASNKPSTSLAKDATQQRRYEKQQGLPKKPKAGRQLKNQALSRPEMLY